jgi:hypothetical protein
MSRTVAILAARLIFAAVHGPGEKLAVQRGLVWKRGAAAAG